jgi:hypothetical protein
MSNDTTGKLPLVVQLERVFTIFNRVLFEGELSMPTHVIQPEKKVVFRWSDSSNHMVVGRKFSTVKTAGDLLERYLHEMVHMWNHHVKRVDCTINQYHNRHFAEVAQNRAGLHVAKHKTQGWSITAFESKRKAFTAPTAGAVARRNDAIKSISLDMAVIEAARLYMQKVGSGRSKQFFLKYVCKCPKPFNSVRSGRRPDGPHAPNIKCLDCGSYIPIRLRIGF